MGSSTSDIVGGFGASWWECTGIGLAGREGDVAEGNGVPGRKMACKVEQNAVFLF